MRSDTSATTPTFPYRSSWRGSSSTWVSAPTSTGSVTGMPGNTTTSSSGMILRFSMNWMIGSKVEIVKYRGLPVQCGHGQAPRAGGLPRLAAPDEVLFRAAAAPAGLGRAVRPLPRAVPRAPPHRAGRAGAHEPPGRRPLLRRLQRDRPGRSPGGARAAAAPPVAGRPPGEGAGADAGRRPAAGRDAAAHDGAAAAALVAHPGRAARAGEAAGAAGGGGGGLSGRACYSARNVLAGSTDRKSTRLNSSHLGISYAVFCLKKKKKIT